MTPLVQQVAADGFAIVEDHGLAELARADPWRAAERLFGAPVTMVERQPLRARADGRSFASTAVAAPLHSDSQLFHGLPPDWQVLFCLRPAADGGDTLLLDTWPWLADLAARDASLHAALFDVERRIPFVFDDVRGPTIALARDRLVVTHSPMQPRDAVGRALAAALPEPRRIALEAGQILVAVNHRVLHGRAAFSDARRELLRLLLWLPRYRSAPERLSERARSLASGLTRVIDGPAVGVDASAVAAMLRGEPPGLLAARLGVAGAHLYAWRDLVCP
jgi:hypothetical protein